MQIKPIYLGFAWAYLILTDQGVYLVDTGIVRQAERIIREIVRLGRTPHDLRLIYLTHAHLDHSGSAAALQRMTGAPIIIHRDDADALRTAASNLGTPRGGGRFVEPLMPLINRVIGPEPCEPDVVVSDGDTTTEFGLDAVVIHTPGHTPGSTTLLVAGEHAFIGDLLTTEVSPPRLQRNYATDWAALRPSLGRVIAATPSKVYAGHGGGKPAAGDLLYKMNVKDS